MYGYQDRYRALPGDDKAAATRWSSTAATGGTAGNGVIEGTWTSSTATHESMLFWDHLRRAGFIAGSSGAENPFNAVSGKMGVQTSSGSAIGDAAFKAGVLSSGGSPATTFTSLIMCSANLPDKIAISVDAQMDDGVGTTGNVRGARQDTPNPAAVDTAADAYAEDGVSTYIVCRQL
jgi:putative intracellular protease/amidase